MPPAKQRYTYKEQHSRSLGSAHQEPCATVGTSEHCGAAARRQLYAHLAWLVDYRPVLAVEASAVGETVVMGLLIDQTTKEWRGSQCVLTVHQPPLYKDPQVGASKDCCTRHILAHPAHMGRSPRGGLAARRSVTGTMVRWHP